MLQESNEVEETPEEVESAVTPVVQVTEMPEWSKLESCSILNGRIQNLGRRFS